MIDSVLTKRLIVENRELKNRIVLQPMEGFDCNEDGSPSELTERKYLNYAKSSAAIIWFEASAVCDEGRTNPRQMHITAANLQKFKALLIKMKEAALKENGFAPLTVLQLTHSGRQSIVPMVAYRNEIYEATRPITDANIVTDTYLDSLPEKYVETAVLAREAGFDGVDMKCCHGYLMQELLSGYNRKGRYGGSFENRIKCYMNCFNAVKSAVPDMLVTARVGLSDMVRKPFGFGTDENGNIDLTEPRMLIKKLIDSGLKLLNVTLGNPYYNPHVNRPFRVGAYKPPEKPEIGLERFFFAEKEIKKAFPNLIVIASGLSYYRNDLFKKSEESINNGLCDLVGFGRGALAYPSFYKDYLNGNFQAKRCCVACSRCTELMRSKYVSGCATFDDYYKNLYEEKFK